MTNQARRALITYALVGEELERTNDFFLGLAPLFTIVAAENAGETFEPGKFSSDLERLFGLSLHAAVSEYLISRLVASGMLARVHSKDEPQYIWKAPESAATPQSIEKDIDLAIAKFSEFLTEVSPLLKSSLGDQQVENLLLDAIVHHDASIRSAETALAQKPTPTPQPQRNPRYSNEFDYFFFQFLQRLRKSKDPLIDKISNIANAAIVSEALLELATPSLGQRPRRVDLTVFLDGPFVMDFIGLSGPDRKSYASYIVEALRSCGCHLLVFRHYIAEIQNNLRALFSRPTHLRVGPTADAILKRTVSEEFAKAVMHNPEQFVIEAGLSTFDPTTFSFPANQPAVFDDGEKAALTQALISRYGHLEAMDRDIVSVQHILRRRRGHTSSDFFQTNFILLTHNEPLAQIVNGFVRQRYQLPATRFGPLIHQRKLFAILWLAVGGEQKQQMSRIQLIRNCARAVEYNPAIINRIREKLDAIDHTKADQFEALISQPRYVQLSFDLARADISTIDERKADEILSALKNDLIAEEKQITSKLVQREREKRQDSQLKLQASVEEQGRISTLLAQHTSAVRKLIELAIRKERKTYLLVWTLIRATLFVIAVASIILALYSERFSANWNLQVASSAIAAIVSFVSLAAGITGRGMNWIKAILQTHFMSALEDEIIYGLNISDVIGNFSVDLFSGQITWPTHLDIDSSAGSLPLERQTG